jgi:hypothetical protein
MLVKGGIQTVSRREIKMMYCLLSRPTHARSGERDWRLEIGGHLPGVRERAVAVVYDPVLFQGPTAFHEDCGVLPVISLIDLASLVRGEHPPFLNLSSRSGLVPESYRIP